MKFYGSTTTHAQKLVTAMLASTLCLGATFATAPAAFADEADAPVPATTPADFTQRSTGMFPDVNSTARWLNEGNRGCNSCHDDLFAVDKDNGTYTHITVYAGLKKGSYVADCMECHHSPKPLAGPLLADPIHVAHYSSPAFLMTNGNCWSCHATTWDENEEFDIVLFEEIAYEPEFGGYPDNIGDAGLNWGKSRAFPTGLYSGIALDTAPAISFELDQMASTEENEYRVLNYELVDGIDTYEQLEADLDNWVLEVQGVNNPRPLTLDDIKAMPSVEFTASQWCFVDGINSSLVCNKPMKGVLLETFIEELGGLAEGINAWDPICCDGWKTGKNTSIESLLNAGAVLVYENYGHDLTVDQGAPLTLFIPGTGGAVSDKNLVGINFFASENPATYGTMWRGLMEGGMGLPINSSWFDNDGVKAVAGEPLTLDAVAWGWDAAEDCSFTPEQVLFSTDCGRNWIPVDIPEDFDPDQWNHITVTWTPPEAGVYILKMKAVDATGLEQQTVSNLMVIVEDAQ